MKKLARTTGIEAGPLVKPSPAGLGIAYRASIAAGAHFTQAIIDLNAV